MTFWSSWRKTLMHSRSGIHLRRIYPWIRILREKKAFGSGSTSLGCILMNKFKEINCLVSKYSCILQFDETQKPEFQEEKKLSFVVLIGLEKIVCSILLLSVLRPGRSDLWQSPVSPKGRARNWEKFLYLLSLYCIPALTATKLDWRLFYKPKYISKEVYHLTFSR